MRRISLIQTYRKLPAYFFFLLFCGHLMLFSLFPHNHIVDNVSIVHSHPYKSHLKNVPFNHNHTKSGFLLFQFISNLIASVPVLFIGVANIRNILNIRSLLQEDNFRLNQSICFLYLPRGPTFQTQY